MTDGALPKGLTASGKLRQDACMTKSAKGKAGKANPNLATELRKRAQGPAPEELEPRAEPIPPAALALGNAFREASRARAAGIPLPEPSAPSPTEPTLCVRLRDSIPEIVRDRRLEKLPWIDRVGLFQAAGFALGMNPREYLDAISLFAPTLCDDHEPSMRPQWARIARILRALSEEATDPQSSFLKAADTAARASLRLEKGDDLLTDRDAALERMRDEVAGMLEQEYPTKRIALWLGVYIGEPWAVEIAQHIPHADSALGSDSYARALTAMHRVRHGKRVEGDVVAAAEAMIRKWLKEMGYPPSMAKAAFDAERAREDRKIGKRR